MSDQSLKIVDETVHKLEHYKQNKRAIFDQIHLIMKQPFNFNVKCKTYPLRSNKITLLELSGSLGDISIYIIIVPTFPNVAPQCYIEKGLSNYVCSKLVDQRGEIKKFEYLQRWNPNSNLHDFLVSFKKHVEKYGKHRKNNVVDDDYKCHGNNDNNRTKKQHKHNGQCYDQDQVQIEQIITTKIELLLRNTDDHLKHVWKYLDAASNPNDKKLSLKNKKVAASTTLFGMEVDDLHRLHKKDKMYNFETGFELARIKINDFETKVRNNMSKMDPNSKNRIISRTIPLLNYMHCVLNGMDAPVLPYSNDYKFNSEIANKIMAKYSFHYNHTAKDNIQNIKDNWQQHNSRQKKDYENNLKNKNDYKFKTNPNINPIDFYQDVNRDTLQYPMSMNELKARHDQSSKERWAQPPDLDKL